MARTGKAARWLAVVGAASLVAGPALPATAAPGPVGGLGAGGG